MAEGTASMPFSKHLRWQMSAEIMKQSKSQFHQSRLLVIFLRGVICCVNFKQLRSADSIKLNCDRQSSYPGLDQNVGLQSGGEMHLIVQTHWLMTTKLLPF